MNNIVRINSDPTINSLARIKALEEENKKLHEKIKTLSQNLGFDLEFPIEWELTPQEAIVLGILYKNGRKVRKEVIHELLYSRKEANDVISIKIIDVIIFKIRAKLEKFDIRVITFWGEGYALKPESVFKITEYLELEKAKYVIR